MVELHEIGAMVKREQRIAYRASRQSNGEGGTEVSYGDAID